MLTQCNLMFPLLLDTGQLKQRSANRSALTLRQPLIGWGLSFASGRYAVTSILKSALIRDKVSENQRRKIFS